ncbi:hypothetical protein EWF20_02175 [Sulfolobus sp. S-194]|nr:hypothetical protein EWF20_02175 [Sulfolobus sp. S-194]
MDNKDYTFGDIRIREVNGKYYVYVIEKDEGDQRRDRYVGSLDKVVNFYINYGYLKDLDDNYILVVSSFVYKLNN